MWRKPCQASPVVHFHLQHWLASVHLRLSWELPVVLFGTRGKPTTLLQTNIAMESGPLIHSKWLHYQRLSTVPKTGSLSLAQGIEGSKNRPTISESSWGLYFKIAIHWFAPICVAFSPAELHPQISRGQNRAAEAPALPADSRPLVSAAAPAAPAVSLLPRQRPRRVVGAAGTGVLCFDGFDHQKWGDYRGKHHGKYMENTG